MATTGVTLRNIYVEVLRTTANFVFASGSGTFNVSASSTGRRDVFPHASTSFVMAYAQTAVRDVFPHAASLVLLDHPASEIRDAVCGGAGAFNLFGPSVGVRDIPAFASNAFAAAGVCSQVRDVHAAGIGSFAVTVASSQVRDVHAPAASAVALAGSGLGLRVLNLSASTEMIFSDMNLVVVQGAAGRAVLGIGSYASQVRDIPASATTALAIAGTGLGPADHYGAGRSSMSLSASAHGIRDMLRSAETRLFIRPKLEGINFALGGSATVNADVNYQGSYQQGQSVTLSVRTLAFQGVPAMPDTAPVANVYDSAGDLVASRRMPLAERNGPIGIFSLPLTLGQGFSLGRYTVAYLYSVAGSPLAKLDSFDVAPGGDVGGAVIALFAYDRPEARYVVAQLSGGTLIQGRNPQI